MRNLQGAESLFLFGGGYRSYLQLGGMSMRSILRRFLDSHCAGGDEVHFGGNRLTDTIPDYFSHHFVTAIEL